MTKETKHALTVSLRYLGIKSDKKLVTKALGYSVCNQLVLKRYEFTAPRILTPAELSFRLSRMNFSS